MTTSDKLREIAEDKKPVHVKPGLYSLFFYDLKQIAKRYGYNLVLHGSLNRDLDLIAIPWVDKPKPEQNMIKSFQRYLSGFTTTCPDGKVHFTVLPGNRHSYIIELNRGNRRGEWMRHKDEQYYLDISVVQLSDLTALISENYVERAKYDEAVRQRDELREALIDMVWQFAYEGTKNGEGVMYAGGLSALEGAFSALGLSDPITVEDFEAAIKNTDG